MLDQKAQDPQPMLDTSGKTLKLKKKTIFNNFGSTPQLFLAYLKTLLYAYALVSIKDEIDAMMLTRVPLVGVVRFTYFEWSPPVF